MHLRTSLLAAIGVALPAQPLAVDAPAGAAWSDVLSSIGVSAGAPAGLSRLTIVTGAAVGVTAGDEKVTVRRIVDARRPGLEIYWDRPVEISRFVLPPGAAVFATERWSGAPVLAGWRDGDRATLWTATDPGPRGFERYPYLPQALADLGIQPPARGTHLWAFFDSSYRLRADMDVMASRWRKAGIAAIHVAAWHYWEPDAERDAYLTRLIETCHRHAILVYAWIEFPHVSEKFWQDHPEWREKTGLLGDAHLDWRKLINLQNPECARQVKAGTRRLASRFDWDGINLGELYFESLEGYSNPARFTPFNDDVRAEFRAQAGFDPVELFGERANDAVSMRKFLNYRADLARRMQDEWLGVLGEIRRESPGLDLVLTHIDDRFDTQIRDLLGADASKVLPLLDKHDFTFLVEDPATIWHLGPQRYPEIAKRYRALTDKRDRLAIDINIVERYQDVYPTKQQTGVELFQLVSLAARSFERVALYFENSILPPDIPLLAASAAGMPKISQRGEMLEVESGRDVSIAWKGPARVDGKSWPLYDGEFVRLPAGRHRVEKGEETPQILDLNAKLIAAESDANGVTIEYESRSRAIVRTREGVRMLPPGRQRVYLTVGGS
jgi:hypothetical protein